MWRRTGDKIITWTTDDEDILFCLGSFYLV